MNTSSIPDKSKLASFDVDAQNTFTPACPDELPVPEGHAIVDELNAQAALASARIGSKDAHSRKAAWIATEDAPQFSPVEGRNMDIRWKRHAEPGTMGFELIPSLPAPADYDYFVWKGVELDMHPYGACYHDLGNRLSTGVIEFLKIRGITTVIVGGLATDYCVKTTVLQLLPAGFEVIVNLGACRGIAPDTTQAAVEAMRKAGARIVHSSAEIR
jgi:nicotinamidase/pyrazinamidase